MKNKSLEPDIAEISYLPSGLAELYAHLPQIAEETFRELGPEQAAYFTNLVNDWIDIYTAISNVYPQDELVNSLLYIFPQSLFKEVSWFQLLFLTGNYPLLHRSLRYVWEMIFRVYYVDTYMPKSLDDPEPGPTIDEKVEWLAQHEREMSQWKFMKQRLRQLVPLVESTESERDYKLLWNKLNESVHPTKALLDKMVIGVPGFLMTDTFDKEWALETMEYASQVFDLIWLAVLERFPKSKRLILQKGLLLKYPLFTAKLGD